MTERAWLLGATGGWFEAANWDPPGVPAPGDILTVVSGSPSIPAATVVAETIVLGGGPVLLDLTNVTFEPGPAGPSLLQIRGGTPDAPADVTIATHGTISYTGQLTVETVGGGTLTIDVGSDGGTADFVIEDKGFVLVSQESRLILTGERVTNSALIHVEGRFEIAAGLDLVGTGKIEIDAGGQVVVAGAVGADQAIVFGDGTGDLTIENPADFHGSIGLTQYGGDRIHVDGFTAKSADLSNGVLTLFSGRNQTGDSIDLRVHLVNPADFDPLPKSGQSLDAGDFKLVADGDGGTVLKYAPVGPTWLEASLPVPVVAETGDKVSLASIFEDAFGTRHPDFYGVTLLPGADPTSSSSFWGQPGVNNIDPLASAWIVNGKAITGAYAVKPGDKVEFLVGNNIAVPPQIQAQTTRQGKGEKAEFVAYSVWPVDPAVREHIDLTRPLSHHTIVEAARAYQAVYGEVLNTNLCNWIADNVAAAAGAPMSLPNANLDPSQNVAGGFWRVAYRSSDTDQPVADWNTLVKPGDVVRLEWAKNGAGHTTTVLEVQPNGELTVYDNIAYVGTTEVIGEHGDVAYWKNTDPAGITIFRLDPSQYLIAGTALSEFMQGSVFDDLIRARAGNDIVHASTGDDVIIGARGGDRLAGGDGDDSFCYRRLADSTRNAPGRDKILDFERGADRIDLSALNDWLAATGGNRLHFGGPGPSYDPGSLFIEKSGRNVMVKADADGDGRTDFAVKVAGVHTLSADDFVL